MILDYWQKALCAEAILKKLHAKQFEKKKTLSKKEKMLEDFLLKENEELLSLDISSTTRIYGELGFMDRDKIVEILSA